MTEVAYDELAAQHQRLEPWIAFIVSYEGCEIGDYFRLLDDGWGIACSAQEYGHAKQMLDMLEEMIEAAKQETEPGGWVYEMVERKQFDHERYMAQFVPERRPDIKAPTDELAALMSCQERPSRGERDAD